MSHAFISMDLQNSTGTKWEIHNAQGSKVWRFR